jgi:hypothetical protein
MLVEAELFGFAERVLVEVLGRIRPDDRAIVLPPMFDLPGIDDPTPLGRVVEQYVRDDAGVTATLGDAAADAAALANVERDLAADQAQQAVVQVAELATAAAAAVTDGATLTRSKYGDLPARDYLLRVTVSRALLAHYVAAYLGSTACPLPEELAKPLWELTEADAETWRERGVFLEPLPIPDQASWRDIFLRTGGHEPHPLGH